MNETDFVAKITHYGLKVRDVIIPTSASILLYGNKEKTKIIVPEHHEHFYGLIKPMELSDERQADLEKLGKSDLQILKIVQDEYDTYIKSIRKKVMSLQKSWSDSFAQQRASYLIDYLHYDNIYHVCDLVVQRNVPYELILELVFDVKSIYGEFRSETPHKDIYVDPRIRKVLEGNEMIPAS